MTSSQPVTSLMCVLNTVTFHNHLFFNHVKFFFVIEIIKFCLHLLQTILTVFYFSVCLEEYNLLLHLFI